MRCVVGQQKRWKHTWSTWKTLTTLDRYLVNRRTCTRCGFTQVRAAR